MRTRAALGAVVAVLFACAGDPKPYSMERAGGETASRPCLGTEWGETRDSPVGETAFTRADARPWATLALYYNDAEGVGAQVASRGGADLVPMAVRGDGVTVWLADEAGRVLPGLYADGRPYV